MKCVTTSQPSRISVVAYRYVSPRSRKNNGCGRLDVRPRLSLTLTRSCLSSTQRCFQVPASTGSRGRAVRRAEDPGVLHETPLDSRPIGLSLPETVLYERGGAHGELPPQVCPAFYRGCFNALPCAVLFWAVVGLVVFLAVR